MIDYLRDLISKSKAGDKFGKFISFPFSWCHRHSLCGILNIVMSQETTFSKLRMTLPTLIL